MKNTYFKKGFSLVELIVVISIMAIFIGISTSVYTSSANDRQIIDDAKMISSLIQDTKQRSISRDLSPNRACVIFQSYNIINPTARTFAQEFRCNGVDTTVNTYNLKYSSIVRPSTNTRIRFTYPIGNLDPVGGQIIDMRNLKTLMCVRITIPFRGSVSVSNPFAGC